MEREEIRTALNGLAKGLTARELFDRCDSAADLNDIVKSLHALKGEGRIRADGMRDSQVVYKVADWAAKAEAAPAAAPAVVAPENLSKNLVVTKPKSGHSATGLRAGLFEMLEKLKAGEVDAKTAAAYAGLSMTVLKSLEVQMEYQRLRKAGELDELEDLPLVPALEG